MKTRDGADKTEAYRNWLGLIGGTLDAHFIKDGKNGFLVPPGDVDKLAAAIGDILENRTRAIEMGSQNNILARKYLENFDQAVLRVQQAINELAEMK